MIKVPSISYCRSSNTSSATSHEIVLERVEEDSDDDPGSALDSVRLRSFAALGAGGMGEVYKARDTHLDRTVTINVLPRGVASDPNARARFEREARAVAALDLPSHPRDLRR